MRKISLYLNLAIKDVFRLWSATQLQVIIISGICLPILILLGLKNGHVAELRKELATSPVGRQIIFWSSQSGDLLSDSVIEEIAEGVDNCQLIIPESQRVVFLVRQTAGALATGEDGPPSEGGELLPFTLYSTALGDPILGQFGADVLTGKAMELVVSEAIAKTVEINIGETVTVEIKRQLGSERENHQLQFKVAGILPSGQEGDGAAIGYAELGVMQLLERYGLGAAIPEWNIPAMESLTALDLYESMLLFCFKGTGTELTENDLDFLESRGIEVAQVGDPQLMTLFGTLKDSAVEELKVYKLQRLDRSDEKVTPIRDTPRLLVRNTEAEDDFIVRWSDPVELTINGQVCLGVGLTLPLARETGGWIKSFLQNDANWFTYQETVSNPFSIRAADGVIPKEKEGLALQLDDHVQVELIDLSQLAPGQESDSVSTQPAANSELVDDIANVAVNADQQNIAAPTEQVASVPATATAGEENRAEKLSESASTTTSSTLNPSATATENPMVVVPVNLLAYLHQHRKGMIEYDQQGGRFIDIPAEFDYTKARLYTQTIDDVPAAVDFLAARDFAVLSESSRIAEIHQQDSSLQMLVVVVALGVFGFGVVTVFSVLVDSTDRKRGTIGILRVMGMTKFGVFFLVLFRALVIGLLAAILCIGVGYLLAYFLATDLGGVEGLSWKPAINVLLSLKDVGYVAVGAILCATFGAVMPALKASSLDPFEAIMEGRFQ